MCEACCVYHSFCLSFAPSFYISIFLFFRSVICSSSYSNCWLFVLAHSIICSSFQFILALAVHSSSHSSYQSFQLLIGHFSSHSSCYSFQLSFLLVLILVIDCLFWISLKLSTVCSMFPSNIVFLSIDWLVGWLVIIDRQKAVILVCSFFPYCCCSIDQLCVLAMLGIGH